MFDHILAYCFLKEKDACRLFAQLISGVWYIHQQKLVHRDLKLENLLLDRNCNVIITDFGFTNCFEHCADDLMQTSCGSTCYAAPELVISEGAYIGLAVDIWSCGIILYAVLTSYLPFDDDPANPDGDDIVEARRMRVCGEPRIRASDQIHRSRTARPGSRTILAGRMDATINYLLYDAPYLHHVEYDHRQFY